mgnify:FL=1|nr:MAG TPA: hypothetical protein [Caudoviricetes sp.]
MVLLPFPFFILRTMSKASKLVADAILGKDSVTTMVNGKTYCISPPTIIKLVKAAKYLDSFEEGKTLAEVLCMLKNLDDACKALSVFIQGDESISDELSKGTLEEVVNGLQTAYSLISIKDFQTLSILAKSAARMIAKPRP